MMLAKDRPADEIDALVAHIGERVARNRSIHRRLPGGGRLHVDRPLPFLCAHRATSDALGEATTRLVTTQAAYLVASADPQRQSDAARLCAGLVHSVTEQMGALLLLELWAQAPSPRNGEPCDLCRQPGFRIVTRSDALPTVVETLRESLAEIRLSGLPAEVEVTPADEVAPPGLPPLSPESESAAGGFVLGLEVRPIYYEPQSGRLFPLVLKMLRSQLSMALKRAFCAFAGVKLEAPPAHFEALGPRAIVQAVGSADRRLCEVADQFDFVLLATPVNTHQQWDEFRRRRGDYSPELLYRPLPFNPHLLKRELFKIRLENVDDPTLALLLGERHQELDRQITMLADRGTPNFLYGSLQVYGAVEDWLHELARQLLLLLPARERCSPADMIGAPELARLAEAEFDRYRANSAGFRPTLEFRDDIASGVMISRDRLLISADMQVAMRRVPALLHHEIGTHLVTYFNGLSQPLAQLSTGLAGYETLQEGLAVLSEFLCGGLSNDRMRTLAARVMACRSVTAGASFVETWRLLRSECGLHQEVAFTTTVRAHRGGGLTKDAIYLRGLHELLQYLHDGHRLEPLLVGKIALRHVPFLRELRRREIVRAAPLRPRYLDEPEAIRRLEACRGMTVLELASTPNAWETREGDTREGEAPAEMREGETREGEAPAEPGSG